jgi:hypothetical protein
LISKRKAAPHECVADADADDYARRCRLLVPCCPRAALMHEAATLVDSVPAAMRALHSVRRWHERIALGLREGSAAMATPAVARSAG